MKKFTSSNYFTFARALKRILICCLLLTSSANFAQFLVASFSPSVQCYSQSGNSATGMVTVPPPNVATYTWVVTAPSSSCQPPSVSSFAPDNSLVTIYFTCCGVYTIDCVALDGSMMVLDIATSTVEVSCSAPITLNTAPGNSVFCTGSSATLTATGANSYTWLPGNTTGPSLVVTTSGCYTVTAGNSGCNSEAVSCVTLQSVSFSVTPATQTVCSAASATLQATSAGSYLWSNGATTSSIIVTPVVTTTYNVTGALGNCTVQRTATVVVAAPTVSVASNVTLLCRGKSATLTASGGLTYTWSSSSSTLSTLVISPTVTTNYTVTGKDAAGCTAKTVKTQSVTICVGTENINQEAVAITLCPNPATNKVTLTRTGAKQILALEVYNLQRQKVLARKNNFDVLELDLTDYQSGLYFIQLESEDGTAFYKFIKSDN